MGQKLQRSTELLNKEMSGQLKTRSYFYANACYIVLSMTVKFFFLFFWPGDIKMFLKQATMRYEGRQHLYIRCVTRQTSPPHFRKTLSFKCT